MLAKLGSWRGANMLAELLMLVVGINVALWFEGKFEDYRESQAEQEYLQGLHDDLTVDLTQLERVVRGTKRKMELLGEAIQRIPTLAEASSEDLASTIFLPSSYDFFRPSDFTYRSMQESGDFRLLEDPVLKKALLSLARQQRLIETLQLNFIQALDDSYIPVMMNGFDMIEMRLADPELINNQTFRNFFVFALQESNNRIHAYESTRDEIASLLEVIEPQIK